MASHFDSSCFDKDNEPLLDGSKPVGMSSVRPPRTERIILRSTIVLLFLLLVVSNFVTLSKLFQDGSQKYSPYPEEIKTFNHTYQTIHTDHEYSSLDQSVADAAWDNYTVNGHVALSNSLATDRGWIIGAKMPGDAGKSIFVIDSYHQLHCLMLIRTMGNDLLAGKPSSSITHSRAHINHCYDSLRQGIMCRADSVPLYVPKHGNSLELGEGQKRRCRDWNALQTWVTEHTACYNGVKCPT